MKIRKANEKDFYESLKIAKSLNHWFSSYSVSNSMPIDFKVNNLVAAIDKNEVIGFLCYSTWEGEMKINWIGVKKDCQSKGVGSYLIKWLENKAKTLNSDYLLVEHFQRSIGTNIMLRQENSIPLLDSRKFMT